jgi:cellulose synthase/poly-beta-1,6-N-acetylglucosamine synthase-like glycosyltransferase
VLEPLPACASRGSAHSLRHNGAAVIALVILFWGSALLLLYAQVGYAALLALLSRLRPGAGPPGPLAPAPLSCGPLPPGLPSVSVIVAAYAEQEVIAGRVANLRALEYPPDRLEVIVACDGSPDATVRRAYAAGADLVLELARGGKIRAQDAGVDRAAGEIVAFSDANVLWDPGALRALVAPFADPQVGYVCGDVSFVNQRGTNQEGLYWRYEMAVRRLESRLRSVTGGNGAIYATRREAYLVVDPIMGHDLSFPFNMVKRGWRAVYAPEARAREKMVPTIEGEFARKRRMMSHGWPIVVRGGMLSPRGYDPLYALMIFSHRVLRYLSPFLHVIALLTSIALLGHGWVYAAAAVVQVAVLIAAALASVVPVRPLLVARYYVLSTASLAAGLWDWLRHGTPAGWEPAEGTR